MNALGRAATPRSGAALAVAVVGAGLAGLTAAHAIRRRAAALGRPLEIQVWEAGGRPGGQLETVREDGFVVEWAANAFRTGRGPTADLVARLGLQDEQVRAVPAANRRYVFHGDRLHRLPSDPISLLRFAPMSPLGRVRVMAEPLLAGRVAVEESVHDYAARHVGREAAELLLGTMVRGVYGGDARTLSVDAAFPVMRTMEREHRSLVVAGVAGMRARKREGKTTWSFQGGMRALVDRLADDLGAALHLNAPLGGLAAAPEGGFLLRRPDGGATRFDAVVLAVPPADAATLLQGLDDTVAHELAAIPVAPIGMVAFAFDAAALRTPPDGFGFLVAPGASPRALGVLIESNVFPGRAPAGTVLLRAILGGVDDPGFDGRSDDELEGFGLDAIDRAWGLAGAPLRRWVGRQRRGIPQYAIGHQARLARIGARLEALPGLHLAGNAYRGIAVGKLVEDADAVAAAVCGGGG
jgi:protoporphyrinogen/coproporphyrinogen III oxidase